MDPLGSVEAERLGEMGKLQFPSLVDWFWSLKNTD
jgi:hypothetical protein